MFLILFWKLKQKAKFKTYEQLKKELSALEVNVKTDAEILNELLAKLKDLLHSDRSAKRLANGTTDKNLTKYI